MNLIQILAALPALLAPFQTVEATAGVQRVDASVTVEVAVEPAGAASTQALYGRDWIAKSGDNICGLKEASQVSNPGVIDFQACLDATPEMKKLRDQKIDPNSPEGIQLTNDATNRVTQACESIRSANGHCSIWKTIRHKDGRSVTDVTDLVKAQL